MVRKAAARRVDALAINPGVHRDDVTRLGQVRRALDGAQGRPAGARVGVVAIGGHVEFGSVEAPHQPANAS
jgi:hypothetical protein